MLWIHFSEANVILEIEFVADAFLVQVAFEPLLNECTDVRPSPNGRATICKNQELLH